jgi:uncharacterized protein YndB with AHSA1/START domain
MTTTSTKRKSNELRISRVYDAPVQAVWDAWTEPDQVARWWGPRGFTITTHSKDLRPGGTWIYTMHGPDGTDYPNTTYYHEVRERELLVYDHGASEGRPPLFRVTVTFQAVGDERTAMEMTMTLATPEAAEEIAKFIKKAGGESTWDRLAEYLEKEASGKEVFVINRCFDAPAQRVFEMWTNPVHLCRWLPPGGLEMEVLGGSIQAGDGIVLRMHGPSMEFYSRMEYREVGLNRIVYTQQFCDRDGRVSRHPLAPTWPETMLTTITLTAEGESRTRVTVASEAYGPCTEPEMDAFRKERGGMTKGWSGSFDKLEGLLLLETETSLVTAGS